MHDERPSGSDHSELWFDFVADIGDGFDATYTIAYLLGQEHLTVEDQTLQRGRFLDDGRRRGLPDADIAALRGQDQGAVRGGDAGATGQPVRRTSTPCPETTTGTTD